jgi:hypothetical protein
MKPTTKLRFVEREQPMHPFYKTVDTKGNMVQAVQKYRVLQQWWAKQIQAGPQTFVDHPNDGEWRDVPLETENE